MKHKLIVKSFIAIIALLFIAGIVLAQPDDLNPIKAKTFGEVFYSFIGVIFQFSVVIAPLLIIIGAFMMLFAGATPSNIALGKKIILYTAVIFGIILIIKALIYYFMGDITFS